MSVTEQASRWESRAKRLKAHTHEIHELLDKRIVAEKPFADRARYGRFLAVQFGFHAEVDPFYRHPPLAIVLPGLGERRKLDLIRQDILDVGAVLPDGPVAAEESVDIPTALGWLYVAEGSSLGAAFLLMEAGKLGLSEVFGARHLAGHPEGRGLHWRRFTAALDAIDLNERDEARVTDGAMAAFRRAHALVEAAFD